MVANLSYHPPESRPALDKRQLFDELRQLIGEASEEELEGLIELFHVVAAQRAAEARQAFESRDLVTLRRAGHTLRSMAASIGAWDLSGVASRLEDQCLTLMDRGEPLPESGEVAQMVERIENELAWLAKISTNDGASAPRA